ncbi:hypothetical protein COLO4_01297 [Corchorus olitorius]|uniref:Uncharacterized protein n=1 Tax=Corchorus olitorius TaxID=93759 RepID=A0A1R3L2N3_9ROSI|nr:hypothetical protein COLO4_01297 [Corchorus olitorius]
MSGIEFQACSNFHPVIISASKLCAVSAEREGV